MAGVTFRMLEPPGGDEDAGPGLFNLLSAGDVLYEPKNMAALTVFLNRHAAPDAEIIIVDRDRGGAGGFIKEMALLGFRHRSKSTALTDALNLPFDGLIHRFRR